MHAFESKFTVVLVNENLPRPEHKHEHEHEYDHDHEHEHVHIKIAVVGLTAWWGCGLMCERCEKRRPHEF
jgi:hypothetical protein